MNLGIKCVKERERERENTNYGETGPREKCRIPERQ